MSSSAPRSAERRRPTGMTALGLVLLAILTVPAPVGAQSALATCAAESSAASEVTGCLEQLAAEVEAELAGVHARAERYFEGLDAITGNQHGSRTLAQARAAFALFRELDCHLVEIDQGIGSVAALHGRACRIDRDRFRIASLVALIGVADAPEGEAETESALTNPLLDSSWRVVEIDGKPTDPLIDISLKIDGDGAIAGIGGCNRYFGTAEIDVEGGFGFGLREIGATRMACPDPVMKHESRYFAALEQVATFVLADDALELLDRDDMVLVRLSRRSD